MTSTAQATPLRVIRPPWHWLITHKRACLRWLLISCAILTIIWTSAYLWTSSQVKQANQWFADRGDPMTLAELIPSIPDEDNAALHYMKAFVLMSSGDPRNSYRLGVGGEADEEWAIGNGLLWTQPADQWNPEDRDAFEGHYQQPLTQSVYQHIADGATLTTCRFPIQISDIGFSYPVPEINISRTLQRHMLAAASWELHYGSVENAAQIIGSAQKFAQHNIDKSQPFLIYPLVGISIEHMLHEWVSKHTTLPKLIREAIQPGGPNPQHALIYVSHCDRILLPKYLNDYHAMLNNPDMGYENVHPFLRLIPEDPSFIWKPYVNSVTATSLGHAQELLTSLTDLNLSTYLNQITDSDESNDTITEYEDMFVADPDTIIPIIVKNTLTRTVTELGLAIQDHLESSSDIPTDWSAFAKAHKLSYGTNPDLDRYITIETNQDHITITKTDPFKNKDPRTWSIGIPSLSK